MMNEKPKRGESRNPNTGAMILIGIGVLFLLANLGILSGIGRLWPLVLVAVGVWMLMGRGQKSTIQREHFSAPVGGAASARVKLALPVGEATVTGLDDASTLIDADMVFVGEMNFVAQGETEKFVSLSQTRDSWVNWMNPSNWNWNPRENHRSIIRLNTSVPTDLDIQGGVGESNVDLSRLNLRSLSVSSGLGELDLTLPPSSEPLDAQIQVGVGELDLTIPTGAAVNARIKGGVGETKISLPADAAVRVEASSGVGDVKISSRLQRVSGDDGNFGLGKKGVWETPNFSSAARQIVIHYEGGIGELKVR